MKKVLPFLLVFILGSGVGFFFGAAFGVAFFHTSAFDQVISSQSVSATYVPDSNRWTALADNIYLEKDSVRYSNNGNTAEIWACFIYPDKNEYSKDHLRLNKKSKTVLELQSTRYNSRTQEEYTTHTVAKGLEAYETEKIIPESPTEVIYNHVFKK